MPVHCMKRGDKWRIVEGDGTIARTDKGNPRDGGGHDSDGKCERQARALNSSLEESD